MKIKPSKKHVGNAPFSSIGRQSRPPIIFKILTN